MLEAFGMVTLRELPPEVRKFIPKGAMPRSKRERERVIRRAYGLARAEERVKKFLREVEREVDGRRMVCDDWKEIPDVAAKRRGTECKYRVCRWKDTGEKVIVTSCKMEYDVEVEVDTGLRKERQVKHVSSKMERVYPSYAVKCVETIRRKNAKCVETTPSGKVRAAEKVGETAFLTLACVDRSVDVAEVWAVVDALHRFRKFKTVEGAKKAVDRMVEEGLVERTRWLNPLRRRDYYLSLRGWKKFAPKWARTIKRRKLTREEMERWLGMRITGRLRGGLEEEVALLQRKWIEERGWEKWTCRDARRFLKSIEGLWEKKEKREKK